ncbi:DUF4190 domain-containing protein [Streptomyces sp. NPDC006798]|uniref:DUF4190 domain-containing protein n=1 Tax=Streptomyces sp. NPDC006798 TaxID=3155462 RepID=UPI003401051A
MTPSVNGFSVASLISGIACCMPPLGLVLGVIGLRQIKRKGQRGKGMAITGIVLSTVSTLLVTLFLATGAANDVWREFEEAADEVASYKTVEDLRTGHCYNLPGSTGKDGEEVSEVRVVDCAEPHEAEVTGVFKLEGYDSYPGDEALTPVAEGRCTAVDRAYALDDWAIPPTMERYFLTPTAESWKLGDRRVTCSYATEGGKKVKVSVRREAASFDPEQLAYLTAENKVLATIDAMPLEDFPESADGHRAWAKTTSAALTEASAALKGRQWAGPVDGLAKKRAAEFTKAKAAWDLAARARDDDSFWLHVYDADSALKPQTEKSIREHLKLATTEPTPETRT